MSIDLCLGDALDVLWAIPDDSIDSLITDPPAGISFMGKAWDDDKGGRRQWIAWLTEIMRECYRVMKPGAHGLVWALPRTSHWTATALEDAGFEVRDVIVHLFGSGFPKSLDVSKAIDKAAGAERDVVATVRQKGGGTEHINRANAPQGYRPNDYQKGENVLDITAPATEEAKRWDGWGTALKPAAEHWILIRKPLSEKTVAANVVMHGTGALNIDASRIATNGEVVHVPQSDPSKRNGVVGTDLGITRANAVDFQQAQRASIERTNTLGRWPANVVLDEKAATMLDDQSGVLSPGHAPASRSKSKFGFGFGDQQELHEEHFGAGGASRFFYVAKPSGKEKNAGLEGKNEHPTVKPVQLMRYLCRMITPPNGTVLDPFMGSGTTGIAATQEGFAFIGIEREQAYLDIAQARIKAA